MAAVIPAVAPSQIGRSDSMALLTARYPAKDNKIKSEYTLDKKAPFDQYESFRISPLRVEDADRDAEPGLSAAIAYGLAKKGMTMTDSDPDIDVQYVFGIKESKPLGLQEMPDEGSYKDYQPETEKHAMLVVNIVDARRDVEVAWPTTGSRPHSVHS